jgi:AcrR family transcriptional regulator
VNGSTDLRAERTVRGRNRRDAQREATRARLFDEAVREFKRTGFADTEIAVITGRVGVSRGAFYMYFTGKDDVLRQLLRQEEGRIAREVRSIVESDVVLEEVLKTIAEAVFRAERRLGRRLVRELCAAQFRPEFVAADGETEHPVFQVVVEAVEARSATVDAPDLASVYLTGLFGLLATGEGSQSQRRRHLDMLAELVANGARR